MRSVTSSTLYSAIVRLVGSDAPCANSGEARANAEHRTSTEYGRMETREKGVSDVLAQGLRLRHRPAAVNSKKRAVKDTVSSCRTRIPLPQCSCRLGAVVASARC